MEFRIKNLSDIKSLIFDNEIETAINQLIALSELDDLKEYRGELCLLKVRLGRNKKEYRIGIISNSEFNLENNRINSFLIEIISDFEKIQGIDAKIRKNYKKILSRIWQQNAKISIDYRNISFNRIGVIEFNLIDFESFGDLLNGIYLEMIDFLPPFTYGKRWALVDDLGVIIKYSPTGSDNSTTNNKNIDAYIQPGTTLVIKKL